ncbi:hypothetical protein [Ruminococcus flavefaciens]|uniref:Uncharacterized protein n=1 Tax=Ruminococcus flavefaciens TaxID=1265 RepID=A0A1M7HV52_RUMFL|nr:hypothetical protein [Ruminococcus flavefaciens]SHM32412.1 hypothetical protein SAMN04487860_103119 [Ruminococcus flavefaciens]
MGNFFTSTQIYNGEKLNKEQFIEKFCKKMAEEGYVNCDYVFVEEGLSKLASVIGMNICNITFAADEVDDSDKNIVFLDFKKARSAITMSQGGKTIEKNLRLNMEAN